MNSFIETNKPALQFCKHINKQLISICEPLYNLGINDFSYFKILNDGRFLFMVTNIDLTEEWLTKMNDFADSSKKIFEIKEPKTYILFCFDENSPKNDRAAALLKPYGITNSFGIYNRDNFGCLTAFNFYSMSEDPHFSRFYLENVHLLEHFTQYFELKAKNLIKPLDNRVFARFHQKLNISSQSEETSIFKNKINQFLLETKLPHTILKCKAGDIRLTNREGQCLYHLSQGKTFKEIAHSLGLSSRTVEYYFNRLKERSGYQSREELIIQVNKGITPIINGIHQKN